MNLSENSGVFYQGQFCYQCFKVFQHYSPFYFRQIIRVVGLMTTMNDTKSLLDKEFWVIFR